MDYGVGGVVPQGQDVLGQLLREGTGADVTYAQYIPITDTVFDSCVQGLIEQAEQPKFGGGQHKGAKVPPASIADTGKPKRKRVRDARQQTLNKLAQIRYRDRKRQKTKTLEDQVRQLQDKVAGLHKSQADRQALQQQNAGLQQELQGKLTELKGARATSSSDSMDSSRHVITAKTPEPSLQQLAKKWLDTVEEVRQLIALLGLDKGGGFALRLRSLGDLASVPQEHRGTMQSVWDRMGQLCLTTGLLCTQVLRMQGPDIESLISATYDRCSSLTGWKDSSKWLDIARDLQLAPEQRSAIISAREQSLAGLKRIYEERHTLNGQAVALLVPSLYGATLPATNGYTDPDLQLCEVLQRLELNLQAEQRVVSEQEYVIFKYCLTPVQSCFFIVRAFPDHCDCAALMNAVWQAYGS